MYYLSYGWKSLSQWLASPLGMAHLKQLTDTVEPLLSKYKGEQLVLMGEPGFTQTILDNKFTHKSVLHPLAFEYQEINNFIPVASRLDKLSVACDSINLAYLPHCLEIVQNPHEVLRETYRALAPEGHVIIAGFNPLSIWGIFRFFARISKKAPWVLPFTSPRKLADWLALLGFDIVHTAYFGLDLPINSQNICRFTQYLSYLAAKFNLPFCQTYVIVAKKRLIPLTPIKPRWQTVENLVPARGLVEPSTPTRTTDY